MIIYTEHFHFRVVRDGPVVLSFHSLGVLLNIRLRRQKIAGQRVGGFIDLVIGGQTICCGLGRNLFVGKITPENTAQVNPDSGFTIAVHPLVSVESVWIDGKPVDFTADLENARIYPEN